MSHGQHLTQVTTAMTSPVVTTTQQSGMHMQLDGTYDDVTLPQLDGPGDEPGDGEVQQEESGQAATEQGATTSAPAATSEDAATDGTQSAAAESKEEKSAAEQSVRSQDAQYLPTTTSYATHFIGRCRVI